MRVGVVGIGNMGFAMAERLCGLGWTVAVRDIDVRRERDAAALGATVCATPAALAQRSDCVLVVVVDAAQVDDVLFGDAGVAAAPLPAARCVVLCPTIAPVDTERAAARLGECGITCIDAPISGGPARARAGEMSMMVACADAAFDAHRELLGALSSKVFRLGERIGDGARTKLVNNLLAGVNLVAASEMFVLAERLGLDLARTLDVIEQSSGQSWIGAERMRRAIAGNFAPLARTALLAKDTRLAMQAAHAADCEPALGAVATALFARACEQGLRDQDDASLFEWLRRRPA